VTSLTGTRATSTSVPDGLSLAIRTEGLTRRFGQHVAVNDVSLWVPRGAVYGFLGPNGSGKTTTIRLLLGLMNAHSGSIEVLGGAVPAQSASVLPRVGTLVEGPAFHPYLSGQDNLRRLDAYDASTDPATRDARIAHALDRVGLGAAARKNFRRYSLGMKQRLGLAAALLRPRDLLILDEPTNGLDPQGTREVRTLIRELTHDGTTVLVSSHLLAEIEQVASHVGIMSAGRLLRQGPLDEVIGTAASLLRIDTPSPDLALPILERLGLTLGDHSADHVTVLAPTLPPEQVNAALVTAGIAVRGLAVERPTLEDLFVSLTGEGFDVVR
jgi:ABC-type multidrug transport system ATPase subunit